MQKSPASMPVVPALNLKEAAATSTTGPVTTGTPASYRATAMSVAKRTTPRTPSSSSSSSKFVPPPSDASTNSGAGGGQAQAPSSSSTAVSSFSTSSVMKVDHHDQDYLDETSEPPVVAVEKDHKNPFSDNHPGFYFAESQLVWSTVAQSLLPVELFELKVKLNHLYGFGEKISWRNKQLLRELHCLREILHDFRAQNDDLLEKRENEARERETLLQTPQRDLLIQKCLSLIESLREISRKHSVPLQTVLPQTDSAVLTFLLNYSDFDKTSSRPSTARASSSCSARPSSRLAGSTSLFGGNVDEEGVEVQPAGADDGETSGRLLNVGTPLSTARSAGSTRPSTGKNPIEMMQHHHTTGSSCSTVVHKNLRPPAGVAENKSTFQTRTGGGSSASSSASCSSTSGASCSTAEGGQSSGTESNANSATSSSSSSPTTEAEMLNLADSSSASPAREISHKDEDKSTASRTPAGTTATTQGGNKMQTEDHVDGGTTTPTAVESSSNTKTSEQEQPAQAQKFNKKQLLQLATSVKEALTEEYKHLMKAIERTQADLDDELLYRDDTVKRLRAHDSVTLVSSQRLQVLRNALVLFYLLGAIWMHFEGMCFLFYLQKPFLKILQHKYQEFSLSLTEAVRLGKLEKPVFRENKQSSSQRLRSLVSLCRSGGAAVGGGADNLHTDGNNLRSTEDVSARVGRSPKMEFSGQPRPSSGAELAAREEQKPCRSSAMVAVEESSSRTTVATAQKDTTALALAKSAGVDATMADLFFS
ncbi:unnamed protein product [Amoebophrya sp. A120]|nr:unnamed protein product [Amoebophrya sp. A120]|eukprot:GSA120T00016479001.1